MAPALGDEAVVYVNGDQQLERLRPDAATWQVARIEETFLARMFPTAKVG